MVKYIFSSRLKREFEDLGVDMSGTSDAKFANTRASRSTSRPAIKRARTELDNGGKARSNSRAPEPRDISGVRDPEIRKKYKSLEKKTQAKTFNRMGKSGEADRHIGTKMPKHLFSGKRGFKSDRR